jgi:hypothetical protein
MAVFVLNKQKRALMPCTEKRAHLLLQRRRVVMLCLASFTTRLKDRLGGDTQARRVKLNPGSKTTGMVVVRESKTPDLDTGAVERLTSRRPTALSRAFHIAMPCATTGCRLWLLCSTQTFNGGDEPPPNRATLSLPALNCGVSRARLMITFD